MVRCDPSAPLFSAPTQRAPTMSDYWFFLSHATQQDNLHYLKRFYEDLAARVADRLGKGSTVNKAEVGFFDKQNLETGDRWGRALTDALQTSRTLVCLYSPNYFKSDYCGKEFQLFRTRLARYAEERRIDEPPLILPVLWDSPYIIAEEMPASLAAMQMQYKHGDLGETYAREGLSYIMRLSKHQDDYQQFVWAFADRLVRAGKSHHLPPLEDLPPVGQVESAFRSEEEEEVSGLGPGCAHFVFVAGCRDELKGKKATLHAYSVSGRHWKPFYPEAEDEVGLITQSVATEVKIQQDVLPVGRALSEAKMRHLEDNNAIVIFVLDPWTVEVNPYGDCVRMYDRENFINAGALVVWNHKDADTAKHVPRLRALIDDVLHRKKIEESPCLRDPVCSRDEMRDELSALIHVIRQRLFKKGNLKRPAPTSPGGPNCVPNISPN